MEAKIKAALVTTATVLVAIYVLRQFPVTDNIVGRALNG